VRPDQRAYVDELERLNRLAIERSVMTSVFMHLFTAGCKLPMSREVKITISVLVAVSVWFLSCAGDRAISTMPPSETVCWFVSDGATYDSQSVELEAVIRSDGLEHLMLFDNDCPAIGLPVEVSAVVAGQPEVKDLLRRVYVGAMRGEEAEVAGIFIGRVAYRPGDVPAVVLKLENVRDIRVLSTKDQ
jgi:hypothetical protein